MSNLMDGLLESLMKDFASGSDSKETRKPLRSKKANAKVAKVYKETEVAKAKMIKDVEESLRLLKSALSQKKTLQSKLWGTIGMEMELWESPDGETMYYNDETNEVEFYAVGSKE